MNKLLEIFFALSNFINAIDKPMKALQGEKCLMMSKDLKLFCKGFMIQKRIVVQKADCEGR